MSRSESEGAANPERGRTRRKGEKTVNHLHYPNPREGDAFIDFSKVSYSMSQTFFEDGEHVFIFEFHKPFSRQQLSDLIQSPSQNLAFPISTTVDDLGLPHTAQTIRGYRERLFREPPNTLPNQEDELEYERLDRIHAGDPHIGETYQMLTRQSASGHQPELPAIRRALNGRNVLYPFFAIGQRPDGSLRPVSKEELDMHKFPFRHGQKANNAIGNVLLAYFNPDVTEKWPKGVHLHHGKEGQIVRQPQLLVFANLPDSQEAFIHSQFVRTLLQDNGISLS